MEYNKDIGHMMKKGLIIGALFVYAVVGTTTRGLAANTVTFGHISTGFITTSGGTYATSSLVGGYGYWVSGGQSYSSEPILIFSFTPESQFLTSDGIERIDDFGTVTVAPYISPDGTTVGGTTSVPTMLPYAMNSSGANLLSLAASNSAFEMDVGYVTSVASSEGVAAIAGTGRNEDTQENRALYWYCFASDPIVITQSLGSDVQSRNPFLSPNGAYIAGDAYVSGNYSAFLYEKGSGDILLLPKNPGAADTQGFGVANDGKTVIGMEWHGDTGYSTVWYSGSGFSTVGLTDHVSSAYTVAYLHSDTASDTVLNSTEQAYAKAISSDGSTIIGNSAISGGTAAAKWSRLSAGNYSAAQLLGTLGGTWALANAVNSDGSVIVGEAEDASSTRHGFRWTSAGMQSIETWLAMAGLPNNLGAVHTKDATGVSADGSIVVGTLTDGTVFIARSTAGLVGLSDLGVSLATSATAPRSASEASDIAMHGSHGHPLMRLAEEGHWTTWLSGDFGLSSSRDSGSYADVAELGVGNRINKNIQLSLSVGKMFAGSKTFNNGKTKQELTYILPEVIANIPDTPVWATLGFQYASGPIDIRRGYMNLGSQDYSAGKPRADIYSVRARADWKDALKYQGVGFTPYVDHQHTEVALASYTETGGGFPAHWNARRQHDDVSRIGIDATKTITKDLKLYATAEQNRWWQGQGAAATGYLVGVSTFNSPSQKYARDWSQFSLGATHALGTGKMSATANASTSGQNPQYWLALSYQYDF